MTLPLRIDRTGGTGKVQEFNPTSETLDDRVMPDALPDIWDAIADGSSCLLYTSPSPRDS